MNQQSSPSASPGIGGSKDRRAGLGRAGYVCGLISALVTLLAALNFLVSLFFYAVVQHLSMLSSGEVVLLLIAMIAVALIGMVRSVSGWRSITRHRQAVAGVALSAFALVPFFTAVVVIYISWTACQPHIASDTRVHAVHTVVYGVDACVLARLGSDLAQRA